MQNEEPPWDVGEGGEEGIPSPFLAHSSSVSTRGRCAAQTPPSPPLFNPPTEVRRSWPRGRSSHSGRPALPRPPDWFFPAAEVGPGAGVRGESARSSADPRSPRDSGGTGSCLGRWWARGRTEAEVSGGEVAEKAAPGPLPALGQERSAGPGSAVALFAASPLPFGDDWNALGS